MQIEIPNIVYKGMDVVLSMPYPKVNDVQNDLSLKEDIRRLYCSARSELSCVLLYAYQADTLGVSNETAEVLRVISMVEMKHLSLLAGVLEKMGEKCVYVFDKEPLALDALDYESCETEIIRKNIEREYRVATDYERVIALCSNGELKALLQRILQDEKKHHEVLSSLYQDRN